MIEYSKNAGHDDLQNIKPAPDGAFDGQIRPLYSIIEYILYVPVATPQAHSYALPSNPMHLNFEHTGKVPRFQG